MRVGEEWKGVEGGGGWRKGRETKLSDYTYSVCSECTDCE